MGIADEIVRALNDRRMILALQPIVTSRSHEPELYECLLRMKRLDGTIVCAYHEWSEEAKPLQYVLCTRFRV